MERQITDERGKAPVNPKASCLIAVVAILGYIILVFVLYPCLALFTNIGFFLAYRLILSVLDPRFSLPDINIAVREGIISTIIGTVMLVLIFIAVAVMSNSSRWRAEAESGAALTARTNAVSISLVNLESYLKIPINLSIPIIPLVLTRTIVFRDAIPFGISIGILALLYLFSRPRWLSKFVSSFGSIVFRSGIDGISVGMLYYYLFWNAPWNFGIHLSPYSLETTFIYSTIASGIAIAFSGIYYGLLRPGKRPRLRNNPFVILSAVILNLPMYFVLLGAVPAADSLRDHNVPLAATFAGIGAIAATAAKLIASGFVAGIGHTIWMWIQRHLFGSKPHSETALVSVVVDADPRRRDQNMRKGS